MIKKIKHNNIDFTKYDGCITAAFNHRVYAESWYLNLMTNNSWDCLVLNDYEAVMPLPFKKKMGIKYIVMPNFCQQLGVFYAKEITTEQFTLFEKKLHRYLVRSYHFNEENTTVFQPKGELRNNYLLNCAKEYSVLKQAYRKNRIYDLLKFEQSSCEIKKEIDFLSIDQLIRLNYNTVFNKQDVMLIKKLLKHAENEKNTEIIQLKIMFSGKCVASNIFLNTKKRVTNSFLFRDKLFNKINTSTVLIDAIIQQSNGKTLDFEGSMVEGIATFFESFRAKKHFYTVYHNC